VFVEGVGTEAKADNVVELQAPIEA